MQYRKTVRIVMLAVCVSLFVAVGAAQAEYVEGYLSGMGDTNTFYVDTRSKGFMDVIYVTFSIPNGVSFFVRENIQGQPPGAGSLPIYNGYRAGYTGGTIWEVTILSGGSSGRWSASW